MPFCQGFRLMPKLNSVAHYTPRFRRGLAWTLPRSDFAACTRAVMFAFFSFHNSVLQSLPPAAGWPSKQPESEHQKGYREKGGDVVSREQTVASSVQLLESVNCYQHEKRATAGCSELTKPLTLSCTLSCVVISARNNCRNSVCNRATCFTSPKMESFCNIYGGSLP